MLTTGTPFCVTTPVPLPDAAAIPAASAVSGYAGANKLAIKRYGRCVFFL
jgi:hypothetical protein